VDVQIDSAHMLASPFWFVLHPVRAGTTLLEDVDVVRVARLTVDGVDTDAKERNVHRLLACSLEAVERFSTGGAGGRWLW
jgi:hypothetical protein